MIFVAGDLVKYTGPAQRIGEAVLCPGDIATVVDPNEDDESYVLIHHATFFHTAHVPVCPQDLAWIESKP